MIKFRTEQVVLVALMVSSVTLAPSLVVCRRPYLPKFIRLSSRLGSWVFFIDRDSIMCWGMSHSKMPQTMTGVKATGPNELFTDCIGKRSPSLPSGNNSRRTSEARRVVEEYTEAGSSLLGQEWEPGLAEG